MLACSQTTTMPETKGEDAIHRLMTAITTTVIDYIYLAIVVCVANSESLSLTAKIFICLPFAKGLLESIIICAMWIHPKAGRAEDLMCRISKYTDWKLQVLEKEEEHRKYMELCKPNGPRQGCLCSSCVPTKANGHHVLCQCTTCNVVDPNPC